MQGRHAVNSTRQSCTEACDITLEARSTLSAFSPWPRGLGGTGTDGRSYRGSKAPSTSSLPRSAPFAVLRSRIRHPCGDVHTYRTANPPTCGGNSARRSPFVEPHSHVLDWVLAWGCTASAPGWAGGCNPSGRPKRDGCRDLRLGHSRPGARMDTGRSEEGRAGQGRAEHIWSQTSRRHGMESRPGSIVSADYTGTRAVLLRRACAVVCMDVRPWLASVCLRNGGSHLSINIREPTRAGSGTAMQADSWIPSPSSFRRHSINAPLFAYKTSHPNAYLSFFTFTLASFLPFGFVPLSPLA